MAFNLKILSETPVELQKWQFLGPHSKPIKSSYLWAISLRSLGENIAVKIGRVYCLLLAVAIDINISKKILKVFIQCHSLGTTYIGSWILSGLYSCYYDVSRSGLESWYKILWTKATWPSLFVYVCGSVAGVSADAGNGRPYMKAVFKKHCPRRRIGSDHKWAELHHLLTNENKTFITLSTLDFFFYIYAISWGDFPTGIKFHKQKEQRRGKFK